MMGFILPMRNWNTNGEVYMALDPIGFILPMRNWNPDAGSFFGVRQFRIYLTYEELKLIHWRKQAIRLAPDLSYLWGIETPNWHGQVLPVLGIYLTYEELKPILPSNQKQWFFRIYLTYEELKPITSLRIKFSVFKDLSYLWGIETGHHQNR